jgi:hypothetical protein
VLFVDYVFNFVLLRNVDYWSESGTPVTPIGTTKRLPLQKINNFMLLWNDVFSTLKLANFVT